MARRSWIIAIAGLALMAGLAAYLGSQYAQHKVRSVGLANWVEADGWRTNPDIGSKAADPFLRAVIARYGLLALSSEETVYFARGGTSDGDELTQRCSYQVTGADPNARWWSLTLYGEDQFLLDNGDAAWSVDRTRVKRDADGAFRIRIAPERGNADNWISNRGADRFSLALRLYNPDADIIAQPSSARLPAVERVACQDSGAEG